MANLCVLAALVGLGICVLGYGEIVGPAVSFYVFCIVAVPAAGWVLSASFARRGYACRARWIRYCVVGTALCWGAAALVVYLLVWQPMSQLRSEEFLVASDAQRRAICHRALIVGCAPHDAFIQLASVGDESSMPYLLWALRRMPDDNAVECTWLHGLAALEAITHQHFQTPAQWQQWYQANSHRTQGQWWADAVSPRVALASRPAAADTSAEGEADD